MKILHQLSLDINGVSKIILFGIPDNQAELDAMFRLRFETYNSLGYFNPTIAHPPFDKDAYDLENKCTYFIAKIDEKVIGTVRLIQDELLPTEKTCFSFKEPASIASIARNQRGELGRLIIIPYDKNYYLPRNLVLLFLVKSVIDFSVEHSILGGYSFITEKLFKKLEKLRFPFHLIKESVKIYPRDGLLGPYFYDHGNVLPIYFITQEAQHCIQNILGKKNIFKIQADGKFALNSTLYSKFLQLLKII